MVVGVVTGKEVVASSNIKVSDILIIEKVSMFVCLLILSACLFFSCLCSRV